MKINKNWYEVLVEEFESEYFYDLEEYLAGREKQNALIYPKADDVFAAFNSVPYDKVKVVIVGQDPYHNPGQATGLAFSVPQGVKVPPSLQNIYKELEADTGITSPGHGDLSFWAKQGVLLLNSVLTVEKNQPGCHGMIGWELFTDNVIDLLSTNKKNLVFMLWGNYAQTKGKHISRGNHLVLEAGHPSPLSVRKFLGCKHFSKCNDYLKKHEINPIIWHIPRLST